MSKVVEGLKYTEEHEWISLEGDVATIGITDFAQSSLGDIVFVELPDENQLATPKRTRRMVIAPTSKL